MTREDRRMKDQKARRKNPPSKRDFLPHRQGDPALSSEPDPFGRDFVI
jgi:hypothetical protein